MSKVCRWAVQYEEEERDGEGREESSIQEVREREKRLMKTLNKSGTKAFE